MNQKPKKPLKKLQKNIFGKNHFKKFKAIFKNHKIHKIRMLSCFEFFYEFL